MVSVPSPLLRLEQQATGENPDTWGDKENVSKALLEQAIAGVADLDMAGGNHVLTDGQYIPSESRKAILSLTGALTGARTLRIPARTRLYYVKNGTTGNHTLTVFPTGGTGVEVAQGSWSAVFCDGTNAELVAFLGDIDTIRALANQAAYNAISNKSSSTMYLVPV